MARIEAEGPHFRKTTPDSAALEEAERTTWARAIAATTQLFVTPRILESNERTVVQERLVGYRRLRDAPAFHRDPIPIAERLGAAMSTVHSCKYKGHLGRHGDLTCENVLYCSDNDTIAIVDWSDARWYRNGGIEPGPHTDLAIFVLSVFAAGIFDRGFKAPDKIVRAFLKGYALDSRDDVRQKLLRNFERTVTQFLSHDWGLMTRARLFTHSSSYRRAGKFIAALGNT